MHSESESEFRPLRLVVPKGKGLRLESLTDPYEMESRKPGVEKLNTGVDETETSVKAESSESENSERESADSKTP